MKDNLISEEEMEEAIMRLIDEKNLFDEEYKSKGEKDGFEWAKSATIKDIREVMDWDPNCSKSNFMMSCIMEHAFGSDELMGYINGNRFNTFAYSYSDGWVDGVTIFWEIIKEKILLI